MNQPAENLQLGLELRDRGLDSVERNNMSWVDRMRRVARVICMSRGNVSSDDLQEYAKANNFHPAHHNAFGCVFRGNDWKCIGHRKSTRPSAHGREIKIWAWKP